MFPVFLCHIYRDPGRVEYLMKKEEFEKEAHRLRPLLVNYAASLLKSSEEAEDTVQDALLKLWFLGERLDEYHSLEALARVITKRLALNSLRKRGVTVPLETLADLGDDEQSPEDYERIYDRIESLIKTLPTVEQAVMRLKHLHGMETEQIAELVSSTPEAVRTALSRARKKMRDYFLYEKP